MAAICDGDMRGSKNPFVVLSNSKTADVCLLPGLSPILSDV